MTVIVPYKGVQKELSALLCMLQFQLHPDDDIYIVDISKNKTAKEVVLRYGSTRCYIFVEPSNETSESLIVQKGLESMKQNNQEGALILYPNNIISTTFIANLKKAAKVEGWNILIPRAVQAVKGVIDPNFSWFCRPTINITRVESLIDAPRDIPLYVHSGEIEENLTMDMLRTLRVGMFENELVVVL